MNILFAIPWNQAEGGVTHVAASLARSLEERGHTVFFLYPSAGWRLRPIESRRGFRAIQSRFRTYPARDAGLRARISWLTTVFSTLPQLLRFCRARQIDLINVHYPTSEFALLADLAKRLDIPLVVSAHGSDVLPDSGVYSNEGMRHLLRHASNVVVPSRTFLGSVLAAYPGLNEKTSFIYNGYDEHELRTTPRPSSKSAVPVALCIAAHVPKKGIDVLLRAMRAIEAGQLNLRLVGDGPLTKQLEALASELNVSDRVTFLGSTNRVGVFREIHDCDFLVLASRHPSESFGLAALEAMVCGKPVIASDIGGLRELIEHEVSGLLVPPEDESALVAALRRMGTDAALRHRLGVAGRQRSKRFTSRSTADEYERLFTRIVRGRPQVERVRVLEAH